MKVAYVAALKDLSGYADAARNNVAALASVGVAVEACPVSFETFKTDCGELGRIVDNLTCTSPTAKIQIIHTVPSVFDKFIAFNKYNIGYTAWESSLLPDSWVQNINRLNEVWVPSKYNKKVFEDSGVDIPVFVMPHTFNSEIFNKEVASESIVGLNNDDFIFYSIFQFLERKGPSQLLKAYLTEFTKKEDVCLLLKTYMYDPTNIDEKQKLQSIIGTIKDKLRLSSYPDISLITCPLSRPQINLLHKTCNCLVSSHCSEGFGVTLAEAMVAGNPVIATDYSGSKDFLSIDNGYPVDYQLTPVYNMPWEAYRGDQTWADINIMDLKDKMRYVFEHKQEARVKGLRAQRYIDDNLSWGVIGNQMKERLEKIYVRLP
jgi:glycosyltransferase involved in cell wall biosynthesis